ncbi:hypothetical protein [Legionella cardiaca]|uniref:Uncharacterized protein n=1 Tax=Legionella cardiaca TaxID=1071983 RepID=A0ABY8AV18_9GAMM|nr:hypothetical protein [Legionella cardiaca]WED44323.1 hypothetical protein PXX05_05925 [Legionella cardiaca]
MTTTVEIIEILKSQPKTQLTPAIADNLKAIKEICDSQYSNQSFYGNAALNRQMLLDENIANLLTPEVLSYLFTNEPTPETKIFRNSGGAINLRDAIYYGFKEGLHVLHMMPNNEPDYNPHSYLAQKSKFTKNTMRIAENISKAAHVEELETKQAFNPQQLIEQYARIVETVNLIKESNKSSELLKVPGYTPTQMRQQVVGGFNRMRQILDVESLESIELDDFCEKFLKSPEAMLDGAVIHLFYDRAHIDAALEQDTKFKFKGKECTFQDIFKVMVSKVATNPDNYPSCAKEQFCLRMTLVESDLQNRFQSEYAKAQERKEEKDLKGEEKDFKGEEEDLNEEFLDSSLPQTRQKELQSIIKTLVENIETPKGTRRTSGAGSTKVQNLNSLSDQIGKCPAEEWAAKEEQFIGKLKELCATRRHALHFWSTPHSVNELATLLEEKGFTQPQKESADSQLKA